MDPEPYDQGLKPKSISCPLEAKFDFSKDPVLDILLCMRK